MNNLASSFIVGITIPISVGPIVMLISNRGPNHGLKTGHLSVTSAAFTDFTFRIISYAAGSVIYALLIEYEGWLQMPVSAVLILFGRWMFLNEVKTSSRVATALDASFKGVFVTT